METPESKSSRASGLNFERPANLELFRVRLPKTGLNFEILHGLGAARRVAASQRGRRRGVGWVWLAWLAFRLGPGDHLGVWFWFH
jgi:hypothetical protein